MATKNNELTFPAEVIPPISYSYDGSEFQISLIEKVANYCGYDLDESSKVVGEGGGEEGGEGEEEKPTNQPGETYENMWKRIWLAIRYLSLLTCWTDNVNDTFITQTRRQTFSTTDLCGCVNKCSCKDDAIVIPLAYAPRPEQPWVGGFISSVVDGVTTSVAIPAEYLYSHTDFSTDLLYIVRSDFPDVLYRYDWCCPVKRKVTVTLKYNAGYDTIPDGLLVAICPILSKIDSAKIGLNDCAAAMTQVVGLLKRKKVGNTEYEWSDNDAETQKTQTLFTDVFDIALLSEIEAISRCAQAEGVEEIGDVV